MKAQLEALYIPPATSENGTSNKLVSVPTPTWMAQRPSDRERAEWAHHTDEQQQLLQQQQQQSNNRQPPPPNRWGNTAGDALVSPVAEYQGAQANQMFNNAQNNRTTNDGPKV